MCSEVESANHVQPVLAPMDVPMGLTEYLPRQAMPAPMASKKAFRRPQKTLLPAPHRPGETPPRADGPTVPPKGADPEDADLVPAPEDIRAGATESGAASDLDRVYVNKRRGDVYARNSDGMYTHIGHLDKARFVPNARTADDPDTMRPVPPENDVYDALPENATDPRVDSAGNVWDLGKPAGPVYLGHTDRDAFIPAAQYTSDLANPTGAM